MSQAENVPTPPSGEDNGLPFRHHLSTTFVSILGEYAAATRGCQVSSRATWLMGEGCCPEPDFTLRILPESGGQSSIEGDFAAGAPELIVEIAGNGARFDLLTRRKLYQRFSVRQYLFAITQHSELIWNVLTPAGYQPLRPDESGLFRSTDLPGLWLDATALWTADKSRLFARLHEGLASPEHAAFVAELAAREASSACG